MKINKISLAAVIILVLSLAACSKQSDSSPSATGNAPTKTRTATQTQTASGTTIFTATYSPTATDTATVTETSTMQDTNTDTPTETDTPTSSVSPTKTATATDTDTATDTPTNTNTGTVTETPTDTDTTTETYTRTPTATAIVTFTTTGTFTPTQTATTAPLTMLFQQLINPSPSYAGCRDTFINTSGGGAYNFGKCTYLYIGSTSSGANKYRTLVYFDISPMPAGATIVSAKLVMTVFTAGADADTNTLNAYAATTSWLEGTGSSCSGAVTNDGATWLKSDGVTAWTAGGDFNPAPIATPVTKTFSDYSVVQINLDPSVVQGWFDTPASNLGMMIKFNNESTGASNIVGFLSSNQTSLGEKPTLTVKYYLP